MKYRVSVGLTLAAVFIGGTAVDAFAAGGCFSGPAKLPDDQVSAFTANPGALMDNNKAGGLLLTGQVRGLVGSSSDALDAFMGQIATANDAQKAAVGSGLAAVVGACKVASPDYVQTIQQAVIKANDAKLTAAFNADTQNQQTNALGTAAAGGAGGGGGGGGLNGGGTTGGSSGGTTSTASAGGTDSTSSGTETFSPRANSTLATGTGTTIVSTGTTTTGTGTTTVAAVSTGAQAAAGVSSR